MRIIFMGTPDFAVPALKSLLASHEVVAVYTQPPRPAGRGQKERKSPVHLLAEAQGIPVHTPVSLKSAEEVEKMRTYGAEIAVVAAYGLLLPEPVLQAFPRGCINIHPSLLPRWRGAAPIQRTVMAGDTETGICIMQMEKGLDTGPVLQCEKLAVPPRITSGQLHDLLAERSAALLCDVLADIGSLKPITQSVEGVAYAKKIEKAEAKIDWHLPAQEIDCLIRGLNPFPGAYFEYRGERVKVWEAEVEFRVQSLEFSGKVLDDRLTVACGKDAIRPLILQRPGGKKINTEDFLRGFPIPPNSKL